MLRDPRKHIILITDSNKNIYGISRVGQAGLNIDNVVKTNFDSGPITNSGSQSDFFVAKYATQACSPLAVNENSSLAPSLYPNPTQGIVQFDNSKRLFTTVSVYTYLGQEVIKALDCSQNENPILDLSKLANGVYLVKLTGVNGTFSTKIVKQ